MNRVYLLLRNNKQTGPFTLDELLELGLKAQDLIWVEGKSFGWSYPTEINTLKSYVETAPENPSQSLAETNSVSHQHIQETPHEAYMPQDQLGPVQPEPVASVRKIYVSMPAGISTPATVKMPIEIGRQPDNAPERDDAKKLEQKAGELREKILASTPENNTIPKPDNIQHPDDAKMLEQKAEELKKKVLAYVPENKNNSKTDNTQHQDEAKMLEQKTEELRKKVLANTPENKKPPEPNNTNHSEEGTKLEQKAEELRKKVLAYNPENKNNSKPNNNSHSDDAKKLEQKAEDLRKKVLAYIPENKPGPKPEKAVVTKYSSTFQERGGEYSSWIYNNNTKITRQTRKKWAALAIAALLIVALGAGISIYPFHKKTGLVSTATPVITPEAKKTSVGPVTPEAKKTSVGPVTSEAKKTSVEPLSTIIENVPKQSPSTKNDISANTHSEPAKKSIITTSPTTNITSKETNKINPPTADVAKEEHLTRRQRRELAKKLAAANKPEANPPAKEVKVTAKETKTPVKDVKTQDTEVKSPVKNDAETASTVSKKKKSLNEKVDAFFSKFSNKKEEATPAEEPPANVSTPPPVTKERKAVHRDDTKQAAPVTQPPPPVETINLADFVKISSNKPSENWMLGIHGLKVTLHNTSTETVKTAEVELRYYTEQNEVLDKKIVNFTNIPPGKTITLPAPDHRLADHADFRLIAVK